ncbi:unnamed protein product [Prorocentrum cordatum]|uniref:Uncharacterized protein n=1 Tax=Prorocentrum cordatum TaxID=2364126 RepID=A0ABN9R546_9DINO|nr:unnamed protein product [Polarella glacialis]
MLDWLMASTLGKRAAEEGQPAEGVRAKSAKGEGKGEESHANARLLRQLESRVRTLEFGAGLAVYGPSDAEIVAILKSTYTECQKKTEGKAGAHGLGPPELQSFAALLSAFNVWLEKQGGAQDSVKNLSDVPNRLLLMMRKSDMSTASTWVKECSTSNTQDSAISRITVKVVGSIMLPDPRAQGPNLLEEQETYWRTIEDQAAELDEKAVAAGRVIRSPLEFELKGVGKVATVEQVIYQLLRAVGFNNKPGGAPRGKLVRLIKIEK